MYEALVSIKSSLCVHIFTMFRRFPLQWLKENAHTKRVFPFNSNTLGNKTKHHCVIQYLIYSLIGQTVIDFLTIKLRVYIFNNKIILILQPNFLNDIVFSFYRINYIIFFKCTSLKLSYIWSLYSYLLFSFNIFFSQNLDFLNPPVENYYL